MAIKAFVFDAYGTLYDVQSVAALTEAAFPGHGDTITQVWRLKQLEYSWLRSLMGRYEDFRVVTRESLRYTLDTIGLSADEALFDRIVEAYNHLSPYPDAADALSALGDFRLAILSNGSPDMLDALVSNSGFGRYFEAVISVDAKRVFKPAPGAYELVAERLGCHPKEVIFVSSNGFDVAGARSFGFKVARIERVAPGCSSPGARQWRANWTCRDVPCPAHADRSPELRAERGDPFTGGVARAGRELDGLSKFPKRAAGRLLCHDSWA